MAEVPAHRRNTSLVFQNYALWPHMTVEKNVAYGLVERKVRGEERRARVRKALAAVRMDTYANRTPNQLSGGQQQRVALARALVVEPDAVLLDEPLSNLDARLRQEMRYEIRRIHDEVGITMVYVTHDQKEALSMADRIAVMDMGRVAQIAAPRTLYRRPANRFVAEFLGEANRMEGAMLAAQNGRGRIRTDLGEFEASFDAPLRAGSPAVCLVRPECLRIGAPAAANSFAARVKSNTYLGEWEQFELDAGERPLRAVLQNPGAAAPRKGDEVIVSFAPEDAILLPTEPEGA
jgi:iron(III) transport system ATP-binding protein